MSDDPQLIEQAYRYPLDPTEGQQEFLASCAGASRFWFNQALALVKARLDQRAAGAKDVDVPWSYHALCSTFPARERNKLAPWQGEVVAGSYMAGFEALGAALQGFSRARKAGRRVGFPRFRAKGRSPESILFQRPRLIDNRHVELDRRCGPIRSRESFRKLTRLLERDERARILRSTVSRRGGRWWISFTVERSPKRRQARRPRSCLGVDLGLASLATLSTGEHVENSRPLEKAQRALRREQRRLDRQRRANNPDNYLEDGRVKPGASSWVKSQRMHKTEARLRELHARVRNLRSSRAHQLTRRLADEHGVIGVESLNVAGMLRNKGLARQITDAGWAEILRQLAYKTSWAGSLLVSADAFYPSSKSCSGCGTVKAKLSLAERVFDCEACGLSLDRDQNAARNLAEIARRFALGEGIREPYVARAKRETLTARGGQVRPGSRSRSEQAGRSPRKREDSKREAALEPPRLRERPAIALA